MTAPTVPVHDVETGTLDAFVTASREEIDHLDASLLGLVLQRQALSRQVQAARVAAGGVRVELSRERAVLDTYARALGTEGTALATAVLRACRGSL